MSGKPRLPTARTLPTFLLAADRIAQLRSKDSRGDKRLAGHPRCPALPNVQRCIFDAALRGGSLPMFDKLILAVSSVRFSFEPIQDL